MNNTESIDRPSRGGEQREQPDTETTMSEANTQTESADDQTKYRVETADGRHSGFSGSKDGAKRMAEECDDLSPDDSPHQVRRVPASAVHEEGGPYPVVWDTDNGDRDE